MANVGTLGIIAAVIIAVILFLLAGRRRYSRDRPDHSPEDPTTDPSSDPEGSRTRTRDPPTQPPITEPPTEPPETPPTEPPERIELILEYLDDMRRFREFVRKRRNSNLSMMPLAVGGSFGNEYYSGDLYLDHTSLKVLKFISKISTNIDEFIDLINRYNFRDYSSEEVREEIEKTIDLYRRVESESLE